MQTLGVHITSTETSDGKKKHLFCLLLWILEIAVTRNIFFLKIKKTYGNPITYTIIILFDARASVYICGNDCIFGRYKYQEGTGWSIWHINGCIVGASVECWCFDVSSVCCFYLKLSILTQGMVKIFSKVTMLQGDNNIEKEHVVNIT